MRDFVSRDTAELSAQRGEVQPGWRDPPASGQDKISSTCSLPDEPYSFVIYGHKIHDSRMYERYRIYGIGK